MQKENTNQADFDKATELLQAVVDWWEEWMTSESPTEVGDPPIEEIQQFLLEKVALGTSWSAPKQ